MKTLYIICLSVFVFHSCASSTSDGGGQTGDETRPSEGGSESSENAAASATEAPAAGMDDELSNDSETIDGEENGTTDSAGSTVGSGGGNANIGEVGCPNDVFLDVGTFQGPGDAYPAPQLEISCTDTNLVVRSNGIPHYTFVARTPNALQAQDFNWTVPLKPTYSTDTSPIPCLGTAGFSVNGIPIYGPNEAQMPDPYGDPVANGVMDEAEGHTGGQGDYHYHALIESAFADADGDGVPDLFDTENAEQGGPSPILGFALDGFPIYGSRGCVDADCSEPVTFKSSYESIRYEEGTVGCSGNTDCLDSDAYTCAPTVVDGSVTTACVYKDYAWDSHRYVEKEGVEWLDECNGRIGPDGTYRYHATLTFPYILGCYHGVVENLRQDVCPEEGASPTATGMQSANGMTPGGRMPPQAATDACVNGNEGDDCQFSNNGQDLSGVCRTPPGSMMLSCVPPMP